MHWKTKKMKDKSGWSHETCCSASSVFPLLYNSPSGHWVTGGPAGTEHFQWKCLQSGRILAKLITKAIQLFRQHSIYAWGFWQCFSRNSTSLPFILLISVFSPQTLSLMLKISQLSSIKQNIYRGVWKSSVVKRKVTPGLDPKYIDWLHSTAHS